MIDVEIEDEAWTAALPRAEMLARGAALAALDAEGAAHESVTILLADDEAVRDLNARFRGKDAATNVLSFPAPANPERHLGVERPALAEDRDDGRRGAEHGRQVGIVLGRVGDAPRRAEGAQAGVLPLVVECVLGRKIVRESRTADSVHLAVEVARG